MHTAGIGRIVRIGVRLAGMCDNARRREPQKNCMSATFPHAIHNQPRLDETIDGAIAWLDREQNADGFWVGMFQSNHCIEAEWLLAMHFLDYEHPRKSDIVATILAGQRADGSWENYYDAPDGDINCTVECYAALRSVGFPIDDERLVRARKWIFAHGGLPNVRVFTRYWLALIGEWPWDRTPNLPPEVIANPRWFPFNIYNFSSWARATLLPLAVLSARRARRALPPERRLDELFPDGRERMDYKLPHDNPLFSFKRLFLLTDRLLHAYQAIGFMPFRRIAVQSCLEWILRHQDADGAWGGIQPPWIYSLMALNAEGYPLDHPAVRAGLEALDSHWTYQRDGSLQVQASESPVWDTMLALIAFQDCEREMTADMERALTWILARENRYRGDWVHKNPHLEPSGWAFERANQHYPDVDDTAVALILLARLPPAVRNRPAVKSAIDRALAWTLGMQCRSGGWAAFDRDNDKLIITMIPFCDFGEALDPPSADVTAHMVEAMAYLGFDRKHAAVDRAYRFLIAEQEDDGSWFGRWGVNHIYGTAAVLPALEALGDDNTMPHMQRAAAWVVSKQNADGGWGETCASYMDDRLRGCGPSTASQTAWALIALIACRDETLAPQIRTGLAWLADTQRSDGSWDEPYFTGTGFPGYGFGARLDFRDKKTRRRIQQGTELQRGFMINYNMYRHYFPLMAMGRARRFLSDVKV
jgi:squalene-hopene/tetraprenyl-beta-curcumene cyclase